MEDALSCGLPNVLPAVHVTIKTKQVAFFAFLVLLSRGRIPKLITVPSGHCAISCLFVCL